MSEIKINSKNRIKFDEKNKAIRSFFNTEIDNNSSQNLRSFNKNTSQFSAKKILEQNADKIFRSVDDLKNIKASKVIEGINSFSARFFQEFKETPVHNSEITVNLNSNGEIQSLYNNYQYDIPSELDPKKIKITEKEARDTVNELASVYGKYDIKSAGLLIYKYVPVGNRPPYNNTKPKSNREQFLSKIDSIIEKNKELVEGSYFIVWDIILITSDPSDEWQIKIDAMTGEVINILDLKKYVSLGRVFDPNPSVTTGDLSLSRNSSPTILDSEAIEVEIQRINPPVNGKYTLDGKYAKMADIQIPTFDVPLEVSGNFLYQFSDRKFLNVMTYYHIDRFQDYIQTELDLYNVCNFPIEIDAQGEEEKDNSHYSAYGHSINRRPHLCFGEGGVRDAEDAQVILHEYGHAIQDNCNPGFDNPRSGLGEGFGDILAAIYYDDKHKDTKTRGLMFSWDAGPFAIEEPDNITRFWLGRTYDKDWLFDGPEYKQWYNLKDNRGEYSGMHLTGQVWCATIFELYRKLGGDSNDNHIKKNAKDLTIRLHLMANFHIPTNDSQVFQAALEIEAADKNLGGWRYTNGIHNKLIYDVFSKRHVEQFSTKEIDIYIDDGRSGGYGSISGQDLFSEKLWKDDYWNTKDIWSKNSKYPDEKSKFHGTASDHEQPNVGETAYLYVKVKNRGKTNIISGDVVSQAFYSTKGKESKFPEDYVSIGKMINQDNILSDSKNNVVIGPFPYKHTQNNESVVIIVECEEDPSIMKNINTSVKCEEFVPFDNNIGMRIL